MLIDKEAEIRIMVRERDETLTQKLELKMENKKLQVSIKQLILQILNYSQFF